MVIESTEYLRELLDDSVYYRSNSLETHSEERKRSRVKFHLYDIQASVTAYTEEITFLGEMPATVTRKIVADEPILRSLRFALIRKNQNLQTIYKIL